MIAYIIPIALLLAPSAVLGVSNTCTDLQEILWKGEWKWEASPAKPDYLEYKVDYVRGSPKQLKGTEHVFNVLESIDDSPLPTVVVEGTFYEYYHASVIPMVRSPASAALQLTFVNFHTKNPKRFASFVIPLVSSDVTEDINSEITKDLLSWDNLVSKDDEHTAALEWLAPILEQPVLKMNESSKVLSSVGLYRNLFLTSCQYVPEDVLQPFFKAIKETANNVVYYPAPEEE